MSLKRYGVLVGRPVDRRLGTKKNPHYHVRLVDDNSDYRIAINVFSSVKPSEVEYLILPGYKHPITDKVSAFELGFHELESTPDSGALDFIRGNLFDPRDMQPLPFDVPGPENDLNEMIDNWINKAMADIDAKIYAFGQAWGEEPQKDKIFGFKPGQGIHDIHMNQGNVPKFQKDDGVWQDGGMFIHFPSEDVWVAIFLKFQSQTWHTDDSTGHPIEGDTSDDDDAITPPWVNDDTPTDVHPDGLVRIIAALVNAKKSPEEEWVTLLNTSPDEIAIDNYALLDKHENRMSLKGKIGAGETKRIQIEKPMALSNKGGIITLINNSGKRVDGVSYTKTQAKQEGWTIKF